MKRNNRCMKKILSIMLIAVVALSSCVKDDLAEIRERLTNLEEWQTSVNSSISALQSIVSALEGKDYVTGVAPLSDGSGYVINFQNSGAVTIKHGNKGEAGETPIIGTQQDSDGKYYWTLNGEWLLSEGIKIPTTGNNGLTPYIGSNRNWWVGTTDTGVKAQGDNGLTPYIGSNGNWWIDTKDTGVKAQGDNGLTPYIGSNGNWWVDTTDTGVKAQGNKGNDAVAPQVRINSTTREWEVSTNGGSKWTSTGVKAQGDAIFASNGIDNTNADYVILTLADGTTKISLPRYKAIHIGTDTGNEAILMITTDTTIALSLPAGFKESDYSALMAQIISDKGTGNDIKLCAATSPWKVTVRKPTFNNEGICNNDASVKVSVPANVDEGEKALLKITIVSSAGEETTAARAFVYNYWDGVNISVPEGNGTQASPLLITRGSELAYIAKQVNDNSDTFEDKYIRLSNDLDLCNKIWKPIGVNESKPFKGNFDGNGKTITGLKYTEELATVAEDKFVGLFGYVGAGRIENLTTDPYIVTQIADFTGTAVFLGGIAGKCATGVTLTNIASKGLMLIRFVRGSTNATAYSGDLIGWMEDGATATQEINATNKYKGNGCYRTYQFGGVGIWTLNGVLR